MTDRLEQNLGSKPIERSPAIDERGGRATSYAVHLYTASGLLLGILALRAIFSGEYATAFWWMLCSVLVDATDGILARRYRVWVFTPEIDGRKLDDIVDYVNYTLVPVVLMGHAGWWPSPTWLWSSLPLLASAFAFAHLGAKEDAAGFFRGFPSYWNIVAFYVWIYFDRWGSGAVATVTVVLSVLCVMPVWFVYPNKAPRWKAWFIGGGFAWAVCLLSILYGYRQRWLLAISMVYPVFYVVASLYLARQYVWLQRARDAAIHPERESQ